MADLSGSFAQFQLLIFKLGATASYKEKTSIVKNFISTFNGDLYLLIKLLLVGSMFDNAYSF